jgi:hypothetical protein
MTLIEISAKKLRIPWDLQLPMHKQLYLMRYTNIDTGQIARVGVQDAAKAVE